MPISNATLAQQISDLVAYWATFQTEYADWLGGSVGGGTNLDGTYPLTDYAGNTSLVECPAQLADDVDNIVTGAAAHKAAALVSETAAAASAATATTQAGLADTARIAAELAETHAETAEASSVNASVTAIAQANLATARAGYAQEWATAVPAVSVAAGGDGSTTFSAKHWAEAAAADAILTAADVVSTAADVVAAAASAAAAAASELATDPDLFGKLADNEIITGSWTFENLAFRITGNAASAWGLLTRASAAHDVGFQFRNESSVTRFAQYLTTGNNLAWAWYNDAGVYQGSALLLSAATGSATFGGAVVANSGIAIGAESINATRIANWQTAYGWGNHASAGYALSSHNHAGVYEPADATILKDADIGVTVQAAGSYALSSHNHAGVYEPADATILKDADIGVTVQAAGSYASSSHNHAGVYEPVFTKNTGFNKNLGTAAGTVSEGNHNHSGVYAPVAHSHVIADVTGLQTALDGKQALDADLTAIAALAGTSGFLKKTAADTWSLDTSTYSLSSHNHAGVYEPADGTILKDADIGVSVAAFAHNHSGVYQPVDGDLTAIAALAGTSGFLKKTAADTWSLDTSSYSLSTHNHSGVYEPADATILKDADIGVSVAAQSHAHAAADITSGTFVDARIAASNVTQHQAALSIAVSQITGTLGATAGGTAQSTYAAGDILYASAVNTLAKLAKGTDGQVLTLASGLPSWAAAAGGGSGISNIGIFRGSSNINITTTEATMDLTSEISDPDGNYSLASDTITVTEAGTYLIAYNLGVSVDGLGGNTYDDITARMTLNGTATEINGSLSYTMLSEGGSGNLPDTSVVNTFVTTLSASDTIRLRASARAGTDMSQIGTHTFVTIMRIA